MANLNVPTEVISGLKLIAKLADGDRQTLTKTLRSVTATLYPSSIAHRISEKIPAIQPIDAQSIVECIISLELARGSTNVPIPELARDVAASIEIGEDERGRLEAWLREILGIEALMVSAKGISVMQDNEKTFLQARIITDIRPVFKEGLSETPQGQPSAAVIVHNLRIAFRESGRFGEFFVALDSNDVIKLKEVLERADAKTRLLEDLLKSSMIGYLNADSDKG